MSDEEKKAVDKIKILIQYLNVWKENFTIVPEDIKYLVTILNLIEKQQKEIEELKQEKEYLNCIIESDKDNYINKDKIKAKIEELKDGTYDAKIVLQSLLEKE